MPLGGLGLARRWLKAQQASVNLRAEFERTDLTQVGCLGIWKSFRAVYAWSLSCLVVEMSESVSIVEIEAFLIWSVA